MQLENLPIIDWNLATKLAGNKREIAEEILAFLVKQLPNDIEQIKACYQAQDHQTLLQLVHCLHGAICYCGLPRLKILLDQLETSLKCQQESALPSLMDGLFREIDLLLNFYQTELQLATEEQYC